MTTGSYDRNLRVATMGKYSGPYTVGLRQQKSWSGTNYPSGKPLRTNVPPPSQVRYRYKRIKFYETIQLRRFRYIKVANPAPSANRSGTGKRTSDIPVTSADSERKRSFGSRSRVLPGPYPYGYTWVKQEYSVPRRIKRFRIEVVSYVVRPSKVYFRPPARARLTDHPYSCTYTNENTAVVNHTYPGVGNFSNASSSIMGTRTINTNWTSNDDLNLIGKLREAVAGSDFNAGVSLGESHRTLDLIANNARRIANSLRLVKKGNLAGAAAALGVTSVKKGKRNATRSSASIQQNWLELQYGWLPLLNDVYSGAQFLAHQLNTPLTQTVRVTREKRGTVTWTGSVGWKYVNSEIRTRSSIKATISEKDVVQLSGLTDPASVAWELVPYSFIVDWFVPIGTYLSARGLSQALTGSFVTSKTYRERHTGGIVPYGMPLTAITMTSQPTLETGNMTRTISSSLQVPLPSFKPLSEVLSWKHCINAIALLSA